MDYGERQPAPGLRPYVRCIWWLRAPAGGGVERVLPDGCPEIIFNRADPFRGRGVQPLAMAVGQLDRFLEITPTGEVDLVGIRFEPAGMHALLRLPMHELTGTSVDLDGVDRRLRRDLEAAARRGIDALEDRLLARVGRPSEASVAVACLVASGGTAAMDDLPLPARRLERRFRAEVGLAPKRLARIVRFHEVVRSLDRGVQPAWAPLALDAGYYDQAHMIRDFRQFAGIAPGAYLREQFALSDLLAGVSDSSNP